MNKGKSLAPCSLIPQAVLKLCEWCRISQTPRLCMENPQPLVLPPQSRKQELFSISIGIRTNRICPSTRGMGHEELASGKSLVAIISSLVQKHSISGLSGSEAESPSNGVGHNYHPTGRWTSSHSAVSYYSYTQPTHSVSSLDLQTDSMGYCYNKTFFWRIGLSCDCDPWLIR